MINAMLVLLAYQLVGEVIVRTVSIPVPGPVVGMLLLFITLLLRDSLVTKIEKTTQTILQNLTLLYVPAAVGVMVHLSLLQREGLAIVITLVASLLVTIMVTAVSMNLLLNIFKSSPKGSR